MTGVLHEVLVLDTGERFACAAEESVLRAMERLNRKGIPVGCRGGGCGVCKVQVVSGRYNARKMSRDHVSADEETSGIGLACRISPCSDLSVRVLGRLRQRVAASRPRG